MPYTDVGLHPSNIQHSAIQNNIRGILFFVFANLLQPKYILLQDIAFSHLLLINQNSIFSKEKHTMHKSMRVLVSRPQTICVIAIDHQPSTRAIESIPQDGENSELFDIFSGYSVWHVHTLCSKHNELHRYWKLNFWP